MVQLNDDKRTILNVANVITCTDISTYKVKPAKYAISIISNSMKHIFTYNNKALMLSDLKKITEYGGIAVEEPKKDD